MACVGPAFFLTSGLEWNICLGSCYGAGTEFSFIMFIYQALSVGLFFTRHYGNANAKESKFSDERTLRSKRDDEQIKPHMAECLPCARHRAGCVKDVNTLNREDS